MVAKTPEQRACIQRWREANPDRVRDMGRRWYETNRERVLLKSKALRQKLRREAIESYGGACVRCGIDDHRVLCFDHVNDDGAEMRRNVHPHGGHGLYRWLKKNSWPKCVQLLCHNCNALKQYDRESFDDASDA